MNCNDEITCSYCNGKTSTGDKVEMIDDRSCRVICKSCDN